MDFFKTIRSPFTKEAAITPLSENDTMWGSEILAALYKQHPYLGAYQTNLQIEGQEHGRGYLYGSFSLNSPGAVPPEQYSAGRVVKQEAPNEKIAKIPVIVEDSRLYSFDVFIDPQGVFWPLNQENVDRALFDANNYAAVSKQEARPFAVAGQDAQPDIPNEGISYGNAGRGSAIKTSSVIEKIAWAVPKIDRLEFVGYVEQDPWLLHCVKTNEAFSSALHKLATVDYDAGTDPDDVSFFMLEKTPGGFAMHYPDPHTGKRETIKVANSELTEFGNLKKEAIEQGAVLIAPNGAKAEKVHSTLPFTKTADKLGSYVLMEKSGSSVKGVVIPDVVRMDGSKTKLALAVTPGGASIQEGIVGAWYDEFDLDSIKGSTPYGEGVFLLKTGAVTEPVIVNNILRDPNGVESYAIQDSWGQTSIVKRAQCIKPTKLSEGFYMIPDDAKFVGMEFGSGVLADEGIIEKIAFGAEITEAVEIIKHAGSYQLRGAVNTDELIYNEALYELGKLGLTNKDAKEKLAGAKENTPVMFIPPKDFEYRVKEASSELGPYIEEFGLLLPQADLESLTKAAAEVADPETVDSVLALNFVNPQNIQGFLEALPQYEQCLNKIAELLIAARVGLPDVKEAVVLTTLRGLQQIVKGLKNLSLRLESMQQQEQM